MKKNTFKEIVKLIVEETEKELEDLWGYNEAGLTSEQRASLKQEIKDCISEIIVEDN